jgi:hypothetical protein
VNLKFTFSIFVNATATNLWHELVQVASSIIFTEEEDAIVWLFNLTGRYSFQSLYSIVNDRVVMQVFTPIMWKIHAPPRIHIFLCLLGNNKILTGDNLTKKRTVDDMTCLFCMEPETTHHLVFDCCVAPIMWETISEVVGVVIKPYFQPMVKWWLKDKKIQCVNICTSVVLWYL